MVNSSLSELNKGLETAFIDSSVPSNLAYKPRFVSNNYREGKKVLANIEDELLSCDSFKISVAFITMSGVTPLLSTFKELEHRGVKGEILTTNYLSFSEPEALIKLNSLSNITIRMFDVNTAQDGFHTKGYIFKKGDIYRAIVGSSNMTAAALSSNKEWNTRIVSTESGEYIQDLLSEFGQFWNSEFTSTFDDFIKRYEEQYLVAKHQRDAAKKEKITSLAKYKLQPNSMQVEFISNMREIMVAGGKRALLISATGTGKTYASAFAMRELGFKRVLFLVHRNQIAAKSMDSYKNVFGNSLSTSLIPSSREDYSADYIFATIQTFSKERVLSQFEKDAFDCIILDEAHHSAASTYKRILDYFEPQMWLGMTATPDRRDDTIDGRNIYEIFDHKIACEIRLQQAMEDKLLCDFHYFGIADLEVSLDETSTQYDVEEFRFLTSEERVKYVMEQASYYGFSGKRVKGLIFCNRIAEANELSKKFNEAGWRTLHLDGGASADARLEAIERLVQDDDDENALDYILSVDIFSEGVDIPEINQVIMLRPTESPIVFIQQLGRGLRKNDDKEYVVVLDFIGNYKNNFMIPIALSGDRSYNKDTVRRYVSEGTRVIPGCSSIHFDEVSKRKIFSAIDKANFSDIKLLKENYTNLKNKLGRIPALADFDKYGEMDVLRIFDNKSIGSYYKFLVKYEKEYKVRLSREEELVIEFISKKLASGKRIHELLLLKRMLAVRTGLIGQLRTSLMNEYSVPLSDLAERNIINVMTNEFPTGGSKGTYKECVFLEEADGDYAASKAFSKMLDNSYFVEILTELVDFGISRYHRDYKDRYNNTDLVLYQKYTYEDVCRLLNWEHNEVPLNIGGYKYDKVTKNFPVFINYEKEADISATTRYEDHFTSASTLIAISKSNRSVDSDDVQNFLYAKERGIDVQLFVRKNKDDAISKEFYYLGGMTATGAVNEIVMPGTTSSAVEIEWKLDKPVREDIYEYIVNA